MKRILHVDINSYFATLLQQENPALRGRPVGVIKDAGRTCVIAASKEAKRVGVRTGCRAKEAKQLAPDIVLVPAEFDMYLDMTKRLKSVFRQLAPTVDVFSLDEAFLDISDCRRLYPDAQVFGRQVQSAIKAELGEWVTCNVGISYTRLLAKLISEISPKGSVTEITPQNRDYYLATAPFEAICGVGVRLEKKLSRLGITNLYQVNFISEEDLAAQVGPFWAPALLRMARGQDSPTLAGIDQRRSQAMKSVGRTITGFQLARDEQTIKQVLYNLCEEAAGKARRMGLAGRRVAIYLRGGGFGQHQSWYRHRLLPYYLQHTQEFFHQIYDELYGSWQRSFPIIKFGVFLSDLKPLDQVPRRLFVDEQRQDSLAAAVDQLNQRYGLFTVRPATLTRAHLIRPEVTGFLGDKTYHGL